MSQQNIMPFAFDDSLVRVMLDENSNPWFVAKDVCQVLGIENSRDALSSLDEDEKADVGITDISSNGVTQVRNMNIISESGLYSLVFRSRKPEAKAFRKWVTKEVLPSLRKTGVYTMPKAERKQRTPSIDFENLPEDVLRIRLPLRERIFATTMQEAKLISITDKGEIQALFIENCRLVGAMPVRQKIPQCFLSSQEEEEYIIKFIKENLIAHKSNRINASEIYNKFTQWWRRTIEGQVPSQKFFGTILRGYYTAHLKGGVFYYFNIAWAC